MLFTQLEALRGKLKSIGLSISFTAPDKFTVIVTPTLTLEVAEAAPHLASPFMLTAQAADLDAGFAAQFSQYESTLTGLIDQTNQQLENMKTAAASAKATAGKKTGSKPATGSSQELQKLIGTEPATDDEDDEDLSTSPAAETPAVAKSAPMSAEDLFG